MQIHIYDRDTQNFVQVDCPDELAGDMDPWDSSFDATAENIFWHNYHTEETLQIVNPLLN